jgi:hypothetical protein
MESRVLQPLVAQSRSARPWQTNSDQRVRRSPAGFVSACVADPGEHEGAGGDTGDAEGEQAWVGLVDTEDRPARQLPQDQQPGSGCDAGGVRGPVGGPERGGDLEDEGDREQRAQAGAAGENDAGDQERDPAADQDRRPCLGRSAPGEHDRQRAGQQRRRGGRDQCRPVAGEREVGEPGGVVHAGERGPRPGDAGGIVGGPQLAELGQELGDRERGRGDRQVVQEVPMLVAYLLRERDGSEREGTSPKPAFGCGCMREPLDFCNDSCRGHD